MRILLQNPAFSVEFVAGLTVIWEFEGEDPSTPHVPAFGWYKYVHPSFSLSALATHVNYPSLLKPPDANVRSHWGGRRR